MFTPKKCMHQDSFVARGQSERKKNEKLWMNRSLSGVSSKTLASKYWKHVRLLLAWI